MLRSLSHLQSPPGCYTACTYSKQCNTCRHPRRHSFVACKCVSKFNVASEIFWKPAHTGPQPPAATAGSPSTAVRVQTTKSTSTEKSEKIISKESQERYLRCPFKSWQHTDTSTYTSTCTGAKVRGQHKAKKLQDCSIRRPITQLQHLFGAPPEAAVLATHLTPPVDGITHTARVDSGLWKPDATPQDFEDHEAKEDGAKF